MRALNQNILAELQGERTPLFLYDLGLLKETINQVKTESERYGFHVHYALKANSNPEILSLMASSGLGADCVSGNEVLRASECGFSSENIVFAGVGKADWEIEEALKKDIFCFNCESIEEIEVLNEIAGRNGKVAKIAIRVNPNVDANTHKYITTGLKENKFGIIQAHFEDLVDVINRCNNIEFQGLHFHIGSQITDLTTYKNLCIKVNEIQQWFIDKRLFPKVLNMGGGLGISYDDPDGVPVSDFANYFAIFNEFLHLEPGQSVLFELGRSIVGQCGNLISKVLYIKKGVQTNFAILDAGMTELIRPALYQTYHKIENVSATGASDKKYDVVGPICETSDCFGKQVSLPETKRGDIIAIRSAGAYGQVMTSVYNLRDAAKSYYFEGEEIVSTFLCQPADSVDEMSS